MKQISTDDVRFRHDDLKSQKSIVVESNYDYTPKRKDELKLKRGATIKVIRRDGLEQFFCPFCRYHQVLFQPPITDNSA